MDEISSVEDTTYFKFRETELVKNFITASRVFHKLLEIFQKVARKNINFLDLFMVSLQGAKICKFY